MRHHIIGGIVLALSAASALAEAPISLRGMGSFHVGGRTVEITGKPVKEVLFGAGGIPAKVDPNGLYLVEHMYVQYFLTQSRKGKAAARAVLAVVRAVFAVVCAAVAVVCAVLAVVWAVFAVVWAVLAVVWAVAIALAVAPPSLASLPAESVVTSWVVPICAAALAAEVIPGKA
jgi:hypothetical protein